MKARMATAATAVALAVGGLAGVATTTASASSYDVNPGQSIQAAINAAAPGATIRVAPGVYHENLGIAKPLTLEAKGVVVRPGGTTNPAPCTQEGNVTGICIHGPVDENFEPTGYLADVTLEGISSRGWHGDGAFAVATDHLDVHDSRFAKNDGYGIFTFHSKRVHYHDSVSHDNGDAGFYIGESPNADVRVDGNMSYDNTAEGILFRDSQGGKIFDNDIFGNCAGLFLLDTGAPGAGGNVKVYDNEVEANNNVCAPSEDAPPFSGIGIGILGDAGTRVTDNTITDHAAAGPSGLPTGGLIIIDTTGFGGTVPTNNSVTDNRFKRNRPVDVFSDGSGSGNTFHDNRCKTSTPASICG
ncbi:MAG: right-handed parallel beta-helix repeat-containing protein [Acidimicrobiia bacterium]